MSKDQLGSHLWEPFTHFRSQPFREQVALDLLSTEPSSSLVSTPVEVLSFASPQVLDTPVTDGYVLTNDEEFAGFFDTFADAQAAATEGAYLEAFESVLIGDIGAVDITVNDMTVASQTGFGATFTLAPGIISFTSRFKGDVDIFGSLDDNVIAGNDDANAIFGGKGDDTLTGGGGGDSVAGGAGDDTVRVTLVTGAANTYLGGSGTDRLFLDFEDHSGPAVTVTLDLEAGRIIGTEDASSDFHDQFSGFERFEMAGAEDVQFDVVGFAEGKTTLSGSATGDHISLVSGQVNIYGRDGGDTLSGAAADDRIIAGDGDDEAYGKGGNDLISLGKGNDLGNGGGGLDTLYGRQGLDTLIGGNGDDALWAGSGNDAAWGGAGNDSIGGASGRDVLGGGDGDDQVFGGADDDTLFGADGADSLLGGLGDDVLFAGAGNDEIFGSSGNDRILASGGADTINAGDGDDTVRAGAGFDSVELGAGFDTVTVFRGNDTTTILDFNVDEDILELWNGLWDEFGAGFFTSTLDLVEEFGSVTETGVELDFGDGDIVVLNGVFDLVDVASASDIVNRPPNAPLQEFVVKEDTLLRVNLFDLALDPDGDPLTLVSVSTTLNEQTNGTTSVNSDGTVQYLPKADFNGVDFWEYTVEDPFGERTTGSISFTMTPVNDLPTAVDDEATLVEDGSASGNVLDNDFDIDSQFLIVDVSGTQSTQLELLTQEGGFIRIQALGDYVYTAPKDFTGIDRVIYPITDGEGARGIGEIVFNVTPVNDDPVAATRLISLREDGSITGNLLVGASDIDGDDLTFTSVTSTSPTPGTLVYRANGDFTYTPSANFFGLVNYQVNISDGNGGTTVGTILFNVTPETDDFTPLNGVTDVGEDGTIFLQNGEAFQVLTTDTLEVLDPDANRTFTFELLEGPDTRMFQDFQLEEDGEFSFRIKEADTNVTTFFDAMSSVEERIQTVFVFPIEEAPHTFSYRVTDQFGQSHDGTHTIRVIGKDNEVKKDVFVVNESRFLEGDIQVQNPKTGEFSAVTNFGNIFANDDLTGTLRNLEFVSADRNENIDIMITKIGWETVPVPEISSTLRETFLITSDEGSLLLDIAENGDVTTYNFGGDLLTSATSEVRLKFTYTMEAVAGGVDDLAGNAGSSDDYTTTLEIVLQGENYVSDAFSSLVTYSPEQLFEFSGSAPSITPLEILLHDFTATEPADIGDYITSDNFQKVEVDGVDPDASTPDLGDGMADAYVGFFSWGFV